MRVIRGMRVTVLIRAPERGRITAHVLQDGKRGTNLLADRSITSASSLNAAIETAKIHARAKLHPHDVSDWVIETTNGEDKHAI